MYSDMLVNSLIKNSAHSTENNLTNFSVPTPLVNSTLQTYSREKILHDLLYGNGPTIDVSDDLDKDGYWSYEAGGTWYISKKILNELNDAQTDFEKQAALTAIVSTIFHEYLEIVTEDSPPSLTGQTDRQGAAVMEEEVWGLNLFGIEDGKEAIRISEGGKTFWWTQQGHNTETGEPNYIIIQDKSAIPNLPNLDNQENEKNDF